MTPFPSSLSALSERVKACTGAVDYVTAAGLANAFAPWECESAEWFLFVRAMGGSVDAALALTERCVDRLGEPMDIILSGAIDDLARRGWNPSKPYAPQLALALLRALLAALEGEAS